MEIYALSAASVCVVLFVSGLLFFKLQNRKLAEKYQTLTNNFQSIVSQVDLAEPPLTGGMKPDTEETIFRMDTPPIDDTEFLFESDTEELVEPVKAASPAGAPEERPAPPARGGMVSAESIGLSYQHISEEHDIPESVKQKVMSRDRHRCRHCGSAENLTVSNILPTYRKGLFTEVTLVTICEQCRHQEETGAYAQRMAG
jgi:hypothetical protein